MFGRFSDYRRRALNGEPASTFTYPWRRFRAQLRWGALGRCIAWSEGVPGWTRGEEAVALAHACYDLPGDPVVVEIGSFLGGSAVLLAGARELRGTGRVYCVDPFDASGDAFSAPVYGAIAGTMTRGLRQAFEHNLESAGLRHRIEILEGTAEHWAPCWSRTVDMLFLDGDQSPEGVARAYEAWSPFLRAGSVLAVHNSGDRSYEPGHDGHRRLVLERLRAPDYEAVDCVGTTTFARRRG